MGKEENEGGLEGGVYNDGTLITKKDFIENILTVLTFLGNFVLFKFDVNHTKSIFCFCLLRYSNIYLGLSPYPLPTKIDKNYFIFLYWY